MTPLPLLFSSMKSFRLALALLLCALALPAWTQATTGNVVGTVKDTSGALVQHAKVSAKNVDTGVVVSTLTDKDGLYNIRFLQVGRYTVTVEAKGFETQVFPAFRVEQASSPKVDFTLRVGETSMTVEVRGSLPPLLNTEDAMTTTTLDANQIQNITNNGRNFSLFSALIPGAVDTSPQQLSGNQAIERNVSQVDEVGVNGNRAQGNNYLLDGMSINEPVGNLIGYNPNLDALSEVKVVSASPSAEYSDVNGSTVLAATKSGTNVYHGTAAIYIENYNLNANSWSNKNKVDPSQIIPINPFTQAIFSGSLGGPVWIPHLFDGHNKLFFFIDYEGTRAQQGGKAATGVLTAKERTGDFSELLDPEIMCGGPICLDSNGKEDDSKLVQLYDPANGFAKYPNNQIPITSPVVKYLIAHPEIYPLPNAASTVGTPNDANYVGSAKNTQRNDQADVKIDWTPTEKDRVSFRYLQGEGSDFERNPLLINFPTPGDYPAKGFTVSYVHTFNTRVVNEFRCCFFRTRYTNSQPLDQTGLFGRKGNSIMGIAGGQTVPGFSQQNFPSAHGVGVIGSIGGGTDMVDNTFNYADNLTIQHGRHLFKMGVQFERLQENFSNASGGALGSFGYSGQFTSNPNVGSGNATTPNGNGFATADFVLGRVDKEGYGGVTGKVGQRQWRNGYYFEDDWKMRPNLTFNLGVRYEYYQPMYEVNNKENNPQPNGNGTVTILTAGVNGASRALYNSTYHDILPRLGVVYHVLPRMVFSIGYGIAAHMEGTGTTDRLVQNPPFQFTVSSTATPPSKTAAGSFFQVTDGLVSGATSFGSTYYSYDKRLQPEMVQQYNVSTQYQLNQTSVLKIAYVGEKGDHLIGQRRGNELLEPCYIGGVLEPVNNSGCGAVDPTPFYSLVGETGNVIVTDSEGLMEYDALQVQYRQLPWKGLEFQANYSYGKALTDTTGFQAVASVSGTGVATENAYDYPLNWGAAGQDERHTLNASAVYNLPFGRGRDYLSNVNHAVDELIGGWKVSMVLMAYTGFPVTVGAATQNLQTYYNAAPQQRPNYVGPFKPGQRYRSGNAIYWWGAQSAGSLALAYSQPGNTEFGNVKVGSLRGPGYQNYDFSLFKDFTLYREHKLGFEVDAFNALNVTSLGNPSSGVGSPGTFGQITSVRGASRVLQVAAKYQF